MIEQDTITACNPTKGQEHTIVDATSHIGAHQDPTSMVITQFGGQKLVEAKIQLNVVAIDDLLLG